MGPMMPGAPGGAPMEMGMGMQGPQMCPCCGQPMPVMPDNGMGAPNMPMPMPPGGGGEQADPLLLQMLMSGGAPPGGGMPGGY